MPRMIKMIKPQSNQHSQAASLFLSSKRGGGITRENKEKKSPEQEKLPPEPVPVFFIFPYLYPRALLLPGFLFFSFSLGPTKKEKYAERERATRILL